MVSVQGNLAGSEHPTLAQEMQLHVPPPTDVLGRLGQVASPLWGCVFSCDVAVTQALNLVG